MGRAGNQTTLTTVSCVLLRPQQKISHSSVIADVFIDFLDKAQTECDHTRRAELRTLGTVASLEDQCAQDNKSAVEKAGLAEAERG